MKVRVYVSDVIGKINICQQTDQNQCVLDDSTWECKTIQYYLIKKNKQ